MGYKDDLMGKIKRVACPTDLTYFQAVEEVLSDIDLVIEQNPKYIDNNILERIVFPNRVIYFKIEWIDGKNKIRVNTGYRVQFNNSLGPYKGGLRFHPSVDIGILKFLAFEQTLKNSLSGQKIGGAKGGSNFDPKGKTDMEIMTFCKAFMRQLYPYIGEGVDVPAGDIGVGEKEIGWLYGEYKNIVNRHEGSITGKPVLVGGSKLRTEATGYGLVYFAQSLLDYHNESLVGKICTVSGAGNVALHTIEKLVEVGAIPVTCSDSRGCIYDPQGIDIDLLKSIKCRKMALSTYIESKSTAKYTPVSEYGGGSSPIWGIPSFMAFPCATQNELSGIDADRIIENNTFAVIEGANMPSTTEALSILRGSDVIICPSKAANVGGVGISGVEMAQNASMQYFSTSEVDAKLKYIMSNIFVMLERCNQKYSLNGDYVRAANIVSFINVADAMLAEGV